MPERESRGRRQAGVQAVGPAQRTGQGNRGNGASNQVHSPFTAAEPVLLSVTVHFSYKAARKKKKEINKITTATVRKVF